MQKLYELEMTRNNVTPRAFYGMVQRKLLKKGGVELESWVGADGYYEWMNPSTVCDAHSTENETICKKPFDFQIAYNGAYNVILEFQFDDDNRGTGYAYICEYEAEEQPVAPQEAANEPEADATEQATNETQADATETPDEYAEARKLHARAHELRLRAEALNNEGKLHDDFVRYVEKLELQANEAVSRACVAKNPRLAAALEKAKAKQGEHAVTEQAATEAADEPAHEFNYDFLSGRYGIFKHEGGALSNEYETDDLKEARDYLKEETEGTVRRVDYAIFDRDARQYIQIRATAKGRKAFKMENERLAAKAATPVIQTESDSAEAGQPAPQGEMTNEEKINALFHGLVPVEGKADTVAGEIVRAVCRIGYRYNNDGDYVGSGYGKETCNPAARYLMANAGENVAEIVRRLWKAGEECGVLDDGSYDDWLSELVKAALAYLDKHPELKTTPNAEDYWNYRDPAEDVDEWEDDDEDEWGAA